MQNICDVQLHGGNDVGEHLVHVSKSWHLNYQTGWHLGVKNMKMFVCMRIKRKKNVISIEENVLQFQI